MRYAVSFTTIAVAGPDRSGEGHGVPVPNRTILVLLVAGVWGCCLSCQRSCEKYQRAAEGCSRPEARSVNTHSFNPPLTVSDRVAVRCRAMRGMPFTASD